MLRSSMRAAIVAAAAVAALGTAHATINQFSASDDGASDTGPWPNSAAAETSFKAAAGAFGSLETATFEGLPTGFKASFNALPNLSVSQTGANYGNGYSGVSDQTAGSLYGFNVTAGGKEFLGTSGDTTTFTFTGGTNAVGFYLTGLQTVFTAKVLVTFNDGTSQVLNAPVNTSGGASYFGFTDTHKFASITVSDVKSGAADDAWGVDNVTFTSTVPEPSSVALTMAGLVFVAGWVARRKQSL